MKKNLVKIFGATIIAMIGLTNNTNATPTYCLNGINAIATCSTKPNTTYYYCCCKTNHTSVWFDSPCIENNNATSTSGCGTANIPVDDPLHNCTVGPAVI